MVRSEFPHLFQCFLRVLTYLPHHTAAYLRSPGVELFECASKKTGWLTLLWLFSVSVWQIVVAGSCLTEEKSQISLCLQAKYLGSTHQPGITRVNRKQSVYSPKLIFSKVVYCYSLITVVFYLLGISRNNKTLPIYKIISTVSAVDLTLINFQDLKTVWEIK